MNKLVLGAVSVALTFFATAHAIVVDLTNVSVNSTGESVVYDDGDLQLVIAPFTVGGTFDNPVFNPSSGLISNGFGVGIRRNIFDAGQIDGFGPNEGLFAEVRRSGSGEVVEFTQIEFNLALTNDNFTIFAGNGLGDLTGIFENVPIDPFNQIAMGSLTASTMMIAALQGNDGFYIESIAFNEIPVPGALPLMAAGLGALGFTRKKHRS
ncbi:MAG: hypothetical protein AAGI89_03340 [Pseudomonadota bacterium]